MPHHEWTNLRRRRGYTHRQLDRYEPFVARLRARLAEIETGTQAILPELSLVPRRYQPNPYFARRELPRIAEAAPARKGVMLPDRPTMKRTSFTVTFFPATLTVLKMEEMRPGDLP